MNHLGDLSFLPLNVSTGDKQVLRVKLANWQLSVSSSWKPSQFCTTLICFLGETTTRSQILFSKQEIRGPHNLWLFFVSKVFPLSALYLSSSHKAKTPIKHLFVKMFPFGCQGGRDRCSQKWGGSQGSCQCFLCQSGNNDRMRNSRWRLHRLWLTGLLPLLLLSRTEEVRSTKNFPL